MPDQLPLEAPKPSGIGTGTVLQALINHYRKPGQDRSGEILITEAQAPGSNRRADLVRVGMWASRGTGIDVHEIKISRADWLRELDNPAKAEAWWPYCNRFWVAALPGVADPAELPDGWGLMEFPSSGRRFKVRVQAAPKEAKLTVPLMVELLRRADNARLAEMDGMRQQHGIDLHKAEQAARNKRAGSELPYETRRRLELLGRLENVLGMPLTAYSLDPDRQVADMEPAELAAVLADARDHISVQRRHQDVARLSGQLSSAARRVLDHLAKDGAA